MNWGAFVLGLLAINGVVTVTAMVLSNRLGVDAARPYLFVLLGAGVGGALVLYVFLKRRAHSRT